MYISVFSKIGGNCELEFRPEKLWYCPAERGRELCYWIQVVGDLHLAAKKEALPGSWELLSEGPSWSLSKMTRERVNVN